MRKKTNDYWTRRLANATWETYNNTNEFHKELIDIYKKATDKILYELFTLETKIAENGVIARTDFYKGNHLRKMEEGFKRLLKDLGERR